MRHLRAWLQRHRLARLESFGVWPTRRPPQWSPERPGNFRIPGCLTSSTTGAFAGGPRKQGTLWPEPKRERAGRKGPGTVGAWARPRPHVRPGGGGVRWGRTLGLQQTWRNPGPLSKVFTYHISAHTKNLWDMEQIEERRIVREHRPRESAGSTRDLHWVGTEVASTRDRRHTVVGRKFPGGDWLPLPTAKR